MFPQIRKIILLQCVIAGLSWFFLLLYNPFAPSVGERIKRLPSAAPQKIVELSQKSIVTRLLEEKDEELVKSEIRTLTSALDWQINEIHVYPRQEIEQRIPVDMRWSCTGDLIKLPVYFEGLQRLSAMGSLEKFQLSFTDSSLDIQLRFFRSKMIHPDWIEKQNLSNKEKSLLRQAWTYQYWTRFQEHEQKREADSVWNRSRFLMEVSRNLSLYRNRDQVVEWSKKKGFTNRSF